MPLGAWALLVASVGLGLGLELAFMWARRRDATGPHESTRGRDATGAHEGTRDGQPDRPGIDDA